ncbi:hypothetical protein [Streptomyces sp. NPDC057552]|uniref:hypothetical protein n=1 Tax=Streptomyces sp. NPDC057552 TaxID=3350537 RepID=UPI0036BFD789
MPPRPVQPPKPEALELLREMHLPPGMRNPPLEVLVPLLYEEAGLSLRRVAALSRVGLPRVRQLLDEADVPIRRPGTGNKPIRKRKSQDAIKLYEYGRSVRDSGAILAVDGRTVRRWLDEAGVPNRGQGDLPMDGRRGQPPLVQLYRRYSIERCAQILGISYGAARNRLIAAGIKPRPRSIRIQWDAEVDTPKLVSLYESGISIEACAQHFRFSYTTARSRLVDAGVTLRPPGKSSNRNTRPRFVTPPSPLPSGIVPDLAALKFSKRHIALLTGLHHDRIHRELALAGLPARMNPDPFGISPDAVADVYRVVASVTDTARAFHISTNAVRSRLWEAQMDLLDRPDPEAAPVRLGGPGIWWHTDQRLLELAEKGMGTQRIAHAVGRPPAEVTNILRIYWHRELATAQILRARQNGESPGVIALRMGLRLDRVTAVLDRYGMTGAVRPTRVHQQGPKGSALRPQAVTRPAVTGPRSRAGER